MLIKSLFSFRQRKCIFPLEKRMTYYKDEYTFSGCMKECRINKCLKFCKCIPPFYKPGNLAKSITYCDLKGLKCLSKYLSNITGINDCQHCELGCQVKYFFY